MIVGYLVYNGKCFTPCPRGKAARVFSYACQHCANFHEYDLGNRTIRCAAPNELTHDTEGDDSI